MSKKRRMKEKRKGSKLVEERRADVRTMVKQLRIVVKLLGMVRPRKMGAMVK